ncbi:2,3-bisphosphoglycerate-independent phosphoglycerate mutase [candidate division WOR-3 bacterium]|uniref:2,3-bisphosphoglycerate-independent phosphoglycerate mutase n=1 Tax=candidate division WOR-3 bacterium TaxID=2052148 RepID=A0A937XFP0_UNCW3|nr:2,3-bisphosphoglycerate-independent phosphoglycerate mutase [candidate division WOR-3 bacterium]
MDLIESLVTKSERKILLVVLDGLGGLPRNGKTELEAASTPNLNDLSRRSDLGLLTPVDVGITPGSGPAHLALFGYDPVKYDVGRGVLEALGIGLHPAPADLCARANFATLAAGGTLQDRRAGRIPTDLCTELAARLQTAIPAIDDVKVIVRPGIGHRFVVVFQGSGLSGGLADSDPQQDGLKPLAVSSPDPAAARSTRVANRFIELAAGVLKDQHSANFVLLRGLAQPPAIPSMRDRFKLAPACVAAYPMYRGLAKLVGMDVLETGGTWDSEVETLRRHWNSGYDFFFLHLKETDKAGEDGAFDAKQELVEQFDDEVLPQLEALKPDVLCITGDHSTPAAKAGHSWHEVPMLLASHYVRPSEPHEGFGERACARGTYGRLESVRLMNLLLAHSLKLKKFGA